MNTLFLLLATSALAANDFGKIPTQFCEHVLEVASRTPDCEQNKVFNDSAAACYAKLEALEKQYGQEADAIAKAAASSQQGKLTGGKGEYEFSKRALPHLRALASLSQKQVLEYKDYLPLPPDEELGDTSDPVAASNNIPCRKNAREGLDKTAAEFGAKIARFDERLKQATQMEAQLKGASSDFSSTGPEIKLKSGPVNSVIHGTPKEGPDSGVSGLQEQKARENQP